MKGLALSLSNNTFQTIFEEEKPSIGV